MSSWILKINDIYLVDWKSHYLPAHSEYWISHTDRHTPKWMIYCHSICHIGPETSIIIISCFWWSVDVATHVHITDALPCQEQVFGTSTDWYEHFQWSLSQCQGVAEVFMNCLREPEFLIFHFWCISWRETLAEYNEMILCSWFCVILSESPFCNVQC